MKSGILKKRSTTREKSQSQIFLSEKNHDHVCLVTISERQHGVTLHYARQEFCCIQKETPISPDRVSGCVANVNGAHA